MTEENIYTFESVETLQQQLEDAVAYSGDDGAQEVFMGIEHFLREHPEVEQEGGRKFTEYSRVWAMAGWQIFQLLDEKRIKRLFYEFGQYFFDAPLEHRIEQMKSTLALVSAYAQKEELKNEIKKALRKSEVSFISSSIKKNQQTISYWVVQFLSGANGRSIFDPLYLVEFMSSRADIKQLSPDDQKNVEGLLRFFIFLSYPSDTEQGSTDIDIYDNIDTATVHVYKFGQDIDTGVPAESVVQMTPEERKHWKLFAQKDSELINDVDIDLLKSGDETPYEQYLDKRAELINEMFNEDGSIKPQSASQLANKSEGKSTNSGSLPKTVPMMSASKQSASIIEQAMIQGRGARNVQSSVTSVQTKMPVSEKALPKPMPTAISAVQNPAPALIRPIAPPHPQLPPKPVPPIPPAPSTQSVPPQPKAQGVSIQPPASPRVLAQQVLREHGLLLPTLDLERRFISALESYISGQQNQASITQMLTAPVEQGGVNLGMQLVQSLLQEADRLKISPQSVARSAGPLTQQTGQSRPTLDQIQEMMTRRADLSESAKPTTENPQPVPRKQETGVEDIFASLKQGEERNEVQLIPAPPQPVQKTPLVRRIEKQPDSENAKAAQPLRKSIGPLDELAQFTLNEFRSFDSDAQKATGYIHGLIDRFGQQGVADRTKAIRAWQQSPVHRLYVQVGNASLQAGTSVDQYIQQQQAASPQALSVQEFDAITQLNRQLRF